MKERVENTGQELVNAGHLDNFEVGPISTLHELKDWRGRAKDWLLWKTPLKRWARKPKLVPVPLTDVLERLWDKGNFEEVNLSDAEFKALSRGAEDVKVWEWETPSNPYETMNIVTHFTPVIPINYVHVVLTTKGGPQR